MFRVPWKEFAVICIALLICFILVIGCFWIHERIAPTVGTVSQTPIIVIDAGHGGFDGGTVAVDGTNEKDINLEIANRVALLFQASGFTVILTRCDDSSLETDSSQVLRKRKVSDMQARLALASKYNHSYCISIHQNYYSDTSCSGAQVFYAPKVELSSDLAEKLQASIISFLQPDNTRAVKPANDDIYLLWEATVPSVIVECGFLSNTMELSSLKDAAYQSKMAYAIFVGFLNHYYML